MGVHLLAICPLLAALAAQPSRPPAAPRSAVDMMVKCRPVKTSMLAIATIAEAPLELREAAKAPTRPTKLARMGGWRDRR